MSFTKAILSQHRKSSHQQRQDVSTVYFQLIAMLWQRLGPEDAPSIDRNACHLRRLLAVLIANGQIERQGALAIGVPSIRLPLEARMTRNPEGSARPDETLYVTPFLQRESRDMVSRTAASPHAHAFSEQINDPPRLTKHLPVLRHSRTQQRRCATGPEGGDVRSGRPLAQKDL